MATMGPNGCAGIDAHVSHALVMASMGPSGRAGTGDRIANMGVNGLLTWVGSELSNENRGC